MNPLLFKILLGFAGFLVMVMLWLGYMILSWFYEDYVIVVKKNGKITLLSQKPKPNKDGVTCVFHLGQEYPIHPDISHELEGTFFWKRMYVFDEKQVRGRILKYTKETWMDTTTFKAIVNDVRIQKLSKDEEQVLKILMIVLLITAVLSGIASVINLLINLGLIKT